MYTLEKSRRVKQLEQIEVENALKTLEKYKKLFQQNKKKVNKHTQSTVTKVIGEQNHDTSTFNNLTWYTISV